MESFTLDDFIHYEIFRYQNHAHPRKILKYVAEKMISKVIDQNFKEIFSSIPEWIETSYNKRQLCTRPEIKIAIVEGEWKRREMYYLLDVFDKNMEMKSTWYCATRRSMKNAKDFFYVFAQVSKMKTKNMYLDVILDSVFERYITN